MAPSRGGTGSLELGSVPASEALAPNVQEHEDNYGDSRTLALSASQDNRLPTCVMWSINLMTAVGMAFLNLVTIYLMKTLVRFKFDLMQAVIDFAGLACGVFVLILVSAGFAWACLGVIFYIAPDASGSGAPENKGWLNGSKHMGKIFTWKNMAVRAIATIFSNCSGFPVGREGPTVTMGSNLAYCITDWFARKHVQTTVNVTTGDARDESRAHAVLLVDQERLAVAKRLACAVGGACGMTMIFDSPIGGIIYMFEEIGAISWSGDMTFGAFGATVTCNVLTRIFLEKLVGTNLKNYVIFQVDFLALQKQKAWDWADIPLFLVIALILGPFSALHTHMCLAVGSARQAIQKRFHRQPFAKIMDGLVFAVICAVAATFVAHLGGCVTRDIDAEKQHLEFVRFTCTGEHEHNPVASLLVTTSEAAMKLLISRSGDFFEYKDLLLAFVTYTTVNVLMTGVPVPSGNFTGTMLIGGFVGRAVGVYAQSHLAGEDYAKAGVYAMMGSAAMLCGFKRMSMAVVLFIAECGDDWLLIPPLMLVVYVSLSLNKLFLKSGFDEEQMVRKNIPFLEPEPSASLYGHIADELRDPVSVNAVLPPQASLRAVREYLNDYDVHDIPVVREDRVCIGLTTRAALQSALAAIDKRCCDSSMQQTSGDMDSKFTENLVTSALGAASNEALFPVCRLMDPAPLTLNALMPAPRVYALFAKAGVSVACVSSDTGEYRGVITRAGLFATARKLHSH